MRKEKNINRLLKIAVLVFMVVLIFPSSNVKADRGIKIENNHFKKAVILSKWDKKIGDIFWVEGVFWGEGGGKILKVKSGNKSVAAVEKSQYYFRLIPKKTGTTKVTVTMLKKNKKITWSGTVQVMKFSNPFQTLKINNKNYKSKLKSSFNGFLIKTEESEQKLDFKLKPGWEIDKSSYVMRQYVETNEMVKSGQRYALKEGEELRIHMEVKNKKSGVSIGISFTIQR